MIEHLGLDHSISSTGLVRQNDYGPFGGQGLAPTCADQRFRELGHRLNFRLRGKQCGRISGVHV